MKQFTELIERVKGGDEQAFEILYQYSYRQIYYTCMSFLKNEQDVYDMMQETYVEVSRSLGQLEDVERFLQWAGTIATRKCYAFLTKNKRYVLLNEEDTTFEDLAGDEKFIPETWQYDILDNIGYWILKSDILYYYEYLPDGYTFNFVKM